MNKTVYLLITIFFMHIMMLLNILIFDGAFNGIVMAINTLLFVFAVGLVLPLSKHTSE